MFRTIATVVALAAALPAAARDWVYVDSDDDAEMASYVDRDSFAVSGDRASAWTYSVLFEAQEGVGGYSARLEYDCKANRSRIASLIVVDADGKTLEQGDLPEEWSPVEPDTVSGTLGKFICSRGTSIARPESAGSGVPLVAGRAYLARKRREKGL